MKNDELKSILEWAEQKGKFIWSDLQGDFEYDNQKMILVQRILRSNMPIRDNLIDHLSVSGEDPNALVLTTNGRTMLTNLRSSSSKNIGVFAGGSVTAGGDIIVGGKKIIAERQHPKNHWYEKPVGIVILGLIIAGSIYLLGWN